LTLLGLEAEAKAFCDCLSEIYEDDQNKPLPVLSDETMLYWRRAVEPIEEDERLMDRLQKRTLVGRPPQTVRLSQDSPE
jgi:hypothetical protein